MSVEEIYIQSIQSLEFIKLVCTGDTRGTVQDFSSLLLMSLPWRQASGHGKYVFFHSSITTIFLEEMNSDGVSCDRFLLQ